MSKKFLNSIIILLVLATGLMIRVALANQPQEVQPTETLVNQAFPDATMTKAVTLEPATEQATETATMQPTPGQNCGFTLQTPYGNIDVYLGDQTEILVAVDFGVILEVGCSDGFAYQNGPAEAYQLKHDDMVYFASGNECLASRDGLGIEWLDVYASGRHLAPAGQVTYSRCEYKPVVTPTP